MASIQDVIDRVPPTGAIPYADFLQNVTTDGNLSLLQAGFNRLRKTEIQLVIENDANGLPVLVVRRRTADDGQGA